MSIDMPLDQRKAAMLRISRDNRIVFSVAVLAMLALAACVPPAAFYEAPAPMPDEPGDIARVHVVTETPAPVDGAEGGEEEPVEPDPVDYQHWVVLYRSAAISGDPTLVSGSVYVPDTPWVGPGPRPIIGYAPGTTGMGDACATSKVLAAGDPADRLPILPFLKVGFAVAVTDYEGIGTPGPHPYAVVDTAAYNLLDMVRAATKLDAAGLDPEAAVGLAGYSQGGQATGRAAELASDYAPELNIKGAAVGGAPADVGAFNEYLEQADSPLFGFLALTALGFDAAYPELELESYLNDDGFELLVTLPQMCATDVLENYAEGAIEDYTVSNPLDSPDWQARVQEQQLGQTAPTIPVLIGHSSSDQLVPFSQSQFLRDAWCEGGTDVTFTEFTDVDHIYGTFAHSVAATFFLGDRMYDLPTEDSFCN